MSDKKIRVGIYGTGQMASRTHIPNLQKLGGVEIVAVCDLEAKLARTIAEEFNIPIAYDDGHEMVEKEEINILYSCVPAFARTDVEIRAVERGIHLFSEKPQSTTMEVPLKIDEAVKKAGVFSTVCFRERYRPIFQEAKRLLDGKQVVHARFVSVSGRPENAPSGMEDNWQYQMDKAGGKAFDWGVHAVDYTRFMTGLDIIKAQAFYCQPFDAIKPLSSSINYLLSSGATMTATFISADPTNQGNVPWFTFFLDGGRLEIFNYNRILLNGDLVYEGEEFDPWFEQSRVFIGAVQTENASEILNDYHDGLYSLAPVLAGWESARKGGETIEVGSLLVSV